MSESTEHKTVAKQPMYIFWVLLLLVTVSILELAIPVGLYPLVYGTPRVTDWMNVPVNEFSNATLWKGRIWYEVLRIGPTIPTGKATLTSFSPEKGDITETSFLVPFPASGMLADGDRFWVIAPGSVTRIEGEESADFTPKRKLGRISDPFFYKDQPAVIELGTKPQATLLVFEHGEWTEAGNVVIPFNYGTATVKGKPTLIPIGDVEQASSTAGYSMSDVKVISHDGQLHLFVTIGSMIVWREGIELAPVSALAPENVQRFADFSKLTDWEAICTTSPIMGRGGKTGWKVGMVNGEPVVITIASTPANPFQNATLVAYIRRTGVWQKVAEQSTPAMMSLMAVTDGTKTYVAGQSLAQTLRLHEVTDTEIQRTGTVLKAPVAGFQEPLQRWASLYQWSYWPGLLILTLGISRLMSVYLDSHYQFGLTTIELASLTRRGIARLIDMSLFWIPSYLLTRALGMGSQEQAAENMDKFFDSGAEGLMLRLVWFFFGLALMMVVFLFVNSLLQGLWGITLGKWICGIRTVRTTLRPCGFFRALFRELLLVVDTLLGSSVIPVTLTIAFTSCRQRIGDLLADTIVIRRPKPVATDENAIPRATED